MSIFEFLAGGAVGGLFGEMAGSAARQAPYEQSRLLQAAAAAKQAEFMRAYALRNEKVEPESEITITEILCPQLNEKNP